ncbi:HhH-GPD domain-containing protein [Plasmodiophora brassicae]|uniref:HhH-GPD domain-containing protein n=1 Tax=Plasmodiophora brassicae TaxID=37360 RepID=A0A0G4IGJ3_PLABS|nr:hypothetical protein PBRA_000098 [Plasmodiophora brassicae]SPQ96665.1 unnamed protein product [Plasmodiophora brassicae]
MPSTSSLWANDDADAWRAVLGEYPKRVRELVPEVGDDDDWMWTALSEEANARQPPHLSMADLQRLMSWKLRRGKFRPQLLALIRRNREDDVVKATSDAFAAKTVSDAFDSLVTLKGVGPATASAILAAYHSDGRVPFMADEAMEAIPDLGVKYTISHYRAYEKRMKERCDRINAGSTSGSTLSCNDLAKCLWVEGMQARAACRGRKRRRE